MLCLSGFELYSRWVPLCSECYRAMPAMLFDVAKLVVLNKNRSLRSTTGFPACKAGDLTMIFVG